MMSMGRSRANRSSTFWVFTLENCESIKKETIAYWKKHPKEKKRTGMYLNAFFSLHNKTLESQTKSGNERSIHGQYLQKISVSIYSKRRKKVIETVTLEQADAMVKKDPTLKIKGNYVINGDGKKIAYIDRAKKVYCAPKSYQSDLPVKPGKRRERKEWEPHFFYNK
jgi:hypothetical protein